MFKRGKQSIDLIDYYNFFLSLEYPRLVDYDSLRRFKSLFEIENFKTTTGGPPAPFSRKAIRVVSINYVLLVARHRSLTKLPIVYNNKENLRVKMNLDSTSQQSCNPS